MREQAEGFVDTLYFRPNKVLPKESKTLTFVVRKGILNDCHAHALSPRQVLIAASNAYVNLDLPNNALRENILLQTNLEFDKQQLESGDTLSSDGGGLETPHYVPMRAMRTTQ